MKIKGKNMAAGIKTTIFLFCMVLFSKELFSNTRLSQLSTGGVQLHIEDCQAGVQRSSRQKKLLKMRSKPNFQKSRLTVTLAMIRTYSDNCPKKHKKSKPNPNPIQTQPNPIPPQKQPQSRLGQYLPLPFTPASV